MKPATNEDEQVPSEDAIDEALAESFPASDPPFWTLGLPPEPEANASDDEQKRERASHAPARTARPRKLRPFRGIRARARLRRLFATLKSLVRARA